MKKQLVPEEKMAIRETKLGQKCVGRASSTWRAQLCAAYVKAITHPVVESGGSLVRLDLDREQKHQVTKVEICSTP